MSVSAFPYGIVSLSAGEEIVEFNLATYAGSNLVADPNDAFVGLRINPNGKVERQLGTGGGYVDYGYWLKGQRTPFDASLWEVITSTTSGSLTSGTIGSAENLSSIRTWTLSQTVVGGFTWDGEWTIRLAGGGADQDTAVTDTAVQVI